ncbi:hypothetical protein M3G91_15975 [Micromonospora chalcea]|uniref:hypothetical protein n=1 Tax=Micromonospora chalcea TaxID=1874 RepID=UPI0021A734A5|nr:hypothetical protein [Micromonospora chalcea]MCT2279114.1 hypothetical protein [Micromonospora chalcea]
MTQYSPPTEEQVKEVLRRIPTAQLRRSFFERLKNPLWLGPLAKEGLFSNPPEPEATPDGLIRDTYWPEIEYLIRVAPDAPESVVDILLKLDASSNAWVRRAVFTIGASIPADQAARLKPLLKSWLGTGFGWRTDPREMVDFAVNLLTGGQYKTGKWIANILFRPGAPMPGKKPRLFLEEYWYAEGLPRIVEVLREDGLKVVVPWLVEYERQIEHLTDTYDVTYLPRDSIRHNNPDGLGARDSVEQSLIDAVRDLAVKAVREEPQTAATVLTRSGMVLGRKIALFAVGEVLGSGNLAPQQVEVLLATARSLLWDEQSRSDPCRIEYAELARAVAKVSPASLEPLAEYLSVGPLVGVDVIRERLRRDQDEAVEELEARVDAYLARWRHRWLAAIGREALPSELKEELADLDLRLGVIDEPLAPVNRVTSWVGPNSPISQDEMAGMSPTELVAHLESWHAEGDGWGPAPSHEGQGRQLTALATTNPNVVSGVGGLVNRLRPTYLRAILRGWEAALKAGLELDWVEVAELIRDVLVHSDESGFPIEGGDHDDDASFRWAKQAAVSLLEGLVKKRDEPLVPHEHLSIFAELLLDVAADEVAWLEYDRDDGDSGMDPLTLSLNWQWPIRLRGILNLMAHGKQAPWYAQARSAFVHEIARADRRGASRAVLGEGIGRLLNVDPEWIEPRVSEFFGASEGASSNQQIALTTAMAVHHYHPKLYDLLAPAMNAAIDSGEAVVAGWRHNTAPLQRIGEWVVEAIICGHKSMDDPVASAFFAEVEPKVRGKALGHMAWMFMHAEEVDDDIRDGLADLWDARVEHVRAHPEDVLELNEFYWFVRSGKFDASWWLPRLKEAVDLNPQIASERYMIGKEIASAADFDPRGALEVTRSLLGHRDEAGLHSWELTRNAVPVVIARAMSVGDWALKQEAIEFMNYLGEQGNVELEQQVNDALTGAITQDDVSD